MQKISTLFERDETCRGQPVTLMFKAECLWAAAGEASPLASWMA